MNQHAYAFPGDMLARLREERGLSLVDASRALRVPAQYLQAIETGQIQDLPAAYLRGFVKSYCRLLDTEAEPFLDALHAGEAEAAAHDGPGGVAMALARLPFANELLAWAAVCGIIALGWLTYTVVFEPQAESRDKAVGATTDAGVDVDVPPLSPFGPLE